MRIKTILASLFAISSIAAGCAVDADPQPEPEGDAVDGDRGRKALGKADHTGTCSADLCGGKSNGTCWCDESCASYGDCCSNYEEICEQPAECETDTDCYLYSNYCNTCTCEAFPNDMHLDQCPVEDIINCFVDPCMAQAAVCQQGQCAAASTTTPPPPPGPTCEGQCGGQSANNECYCDDLCSGYGDCCTDYLDHCE